MKHEVTRERALPAFQIDLAQLEALLGRLSSLFPGAGLRQSLDLSLRGEQWTFETVDEVRQCKELPDSLTDFRVWLNEGPRRVWIRSGRFLGAAVSAAAENESWCAGAVETVSSFLHMHRRWYSAIRGWPIGALTLVSWNLYMLLRLVGFKSITGQTSFLGAWLACVAVFTALYAFRGRLFPAAVLNVRSKESMLRRHIPELTLLVAVLALVLTILGWLVGR